ncbi:hypothetical protein PF003_g6909 [Phytophthora fragariae]|nr:hypothetical protein PF003_g6909 [Phytophthora fragariae]
MSTLITSDESSRPSAKSSCFIAVAKHYLSFVAFVRAPLTMDLLTEIKPLALPVERRGENTATEMSVMGNESSSTECPKTFADVEVDDVEEASYTAIPQ